MFPDIVENSHKALKQLNKGGTCNLRLRELVCSTGKGELFASNSGEYISRFVTISITFPFSFLMVDETMDLVNVSCIGTVGRLDFSRSIT